MTHSTHSGATSWLARLQRLVAAIVLLPVYLYRAVLSPLKGGPTCRFLPTCSEYAVDAVRQRGIVVGGALAAWRIARCHPLCRGGFDPVPPKALVHRELG